MNAAGLLVSVRDADEAGAALRGGAAIIDVKEPLHGPLGCAEGAVAAAVAAVVGGRAAWTVALGELADGVAVVHHRLASVEAALGDAIERPHAVKVGLAGLAGTDWTRRLAEVDRRRSRDTALVAVAYADWDAAGAPHPDEVIASATRLGCRWVLFDTAVKGAAGLLDGVSAPAVAGWVARARKVGLRVAVAGSLSLDDLESRPLPDCDVVGVRTAVCSGGRYGRVVEERVRRAAVALRRVGPAPTDARGVER